MFYVRAINRVRRATRRGTAPHLNVPNSQNRMAHAIQPMTAPLPRNCSGTAHRRSLPFKNQDRACAKASRDFRSPASSPTAGPGQLGEDNVFFWQCGSSAAEVRRRLHQVLEQVLPSWRAVLGDREDEALRVLVEVAVARLPVVRAAPVKPLSHRKGAGEHPAE